MFALEAAKVLEYVPTNCTHPIFATDHQHCCSSRCQSFQLSCAFLLIVIMRTVDLVALLDACMGNCVHSKLVLNFQVIYLSGSRGMSVVKHP